VRGEGTGKPEGNELLTGPRCRWENNIKMDLQEVGWWDIDSIDLAQDSSEPLVSIKCREFQVLLMTYYLLRYDCYMDLLSLLLM
jgi:hypothetical protein